MRNCQCLYIPEGFALRLNQSFAFKFLWEKFQPNSLIPIQIYNGFLFSYNAIWVGSKPLSHQVKKMSFYEIFRAPFQKLVHSGNY
jgi:hypothetical protein